MSDKLPIIDCRLCGDEATHVRPGINDTGPRLTPVCDEHADRGNDDPFDDAELSWRDFAECRGHEDLFLDVLFKLPSKAYRAKREDTARPGKRAVSDEQLADGKEICRRCPVTTECLETAIVGQERWGLWGGMTPYERDALAKKARQAAKARREGRL